MKSNVETRLQRLETQLRQGNGVAIVTKIEGGYELRGGEVVKTLEELHKRYNVIIVDDIRYTMQHPETWSDFERSCFEEDARLNGRNYLH